MVISFLLQLQFIDKGCHVKLQCLKCKVWQRASRIHVCKKKQIEKQPKPLSPKKPAKKDRASKYYLTTPQKSKWRSEPVTPKTPASKKKTVTFKEENELLGFIIAT